MKFGETSLAASSPVMRRFLIIVLSTIALLSHASSAKGDDAPYPYHYWLKMPSDTLVKIGSKYAEIDNKPDSALMCFNIIIGRYKSNLNDEEKHFLLKAYTGRWFVFFFHYFDYSQAYDNLSHAQELAEDIGKGIGRVLLNFGCMYQTVSEQSGDLKPDSLALDYYKRSYWQSREEKDTFTWKMAISNMITVAYTLKSLGQIEKELSNYRALPKQNGTDLYNQLLYEGLHALENGRYDEAIEAFQKQYGLVDGDIGNIRYTYVIHTNLSRVYVAKKEYQRAIDMLMTADSIANVLDMKDAKLEVYDLMASCYEKLGMRQETENYHNKYFRLKDSLLNYHQVASVDEMRFLGEMKKADKQIQEMEQHGKVLRLVIGAVILISLVILLAMYIIWRKNRQLRQRNEALYLKNVEMLRKEEEERKRRRELEKLVTQQGDAKPKYRTNSLDDDAKDKLYEEIVCVMENSEEIFSSEFSAQRLAALVGEKYNYVSQVINERYGANFNTLLNEYRIQEACKRINDPRKYGNYTMEAIANSVGFRSRTSFTQAFKKYTGLTPSEYQRIANEKK
ncbi:MAG: helix-turn-helix domain-containing protein [Prevotella sp.]|nr:helix-turn-helix domain-containing protein [Prevotella sp.]